MDAEHQPQGQYPDGGPAHDAARHWESRTRRLDRAQRRGYPPWVMTGDELRRQRGRLRLTQRELADRVGVGLRTVTGWEARGPRALPATAEGRLHAVLGFSDIG